MQPNHHGNSNIVLASPKNHTSLKEDYDSIEMDETDGDYSRNIKLPTSTYHNAENIKGTKITSDKMENQHNVHSNLKESIQPCKICNNKKDSNSNMEPIDYSLGNSKLVNDGNCFDIHIPNISTNEESMSGISQRSDDISPTTILRVPNFGNKSRFNDLDFKGSEYRRTCNGKNKPYFLELRSREKPIRSISDKSSEKTKQQLNRVYCKAYREKQ